MDEEEKTLERTTLIKRCQAGDLESFEQLYKLYYKKAMGTAYLIAKNKEIAEDIVQEAFFQCYKKIKGLKDPVAFDVWFYRLLVRFSWKLSSENKYAKPIDEISDFAVYSEGGLNAEPDLPEIRMAVHEAIDKLSDPLKTVVILYYFNDMTIKQISMVLGCFQGTVKSRLHNAKKILQKSLYDGEVDEAYKSIFMSKECENNA